MMSTDDIRRVEKEIEKLKALLREREAALPAHSIRPHQMQVVMDLEDEIAEKELQLKTAKAPSTK